MRFRGFIAADLPTTDRLEPLVRELRTSGAPLKLVATGQLHATLKVLGDTEEGTAGGVPRRPPFPALPPRRGGVPEPVPDECRVGGTRGRRASRADCCPSRYGAGAPRRPAREAGA